MKFPNDLKEIINRFEIGQETETDRKSLFELLENKNPKTLGEVAKYINNIGHVKNSQIGDKLSIGEFNEEIFKDLIQIIKSQGEHKFAKRLTWLYFLLLVFVCILFASLSLTLPESDTLARFVMSTIGATFFALFINLILSNTNYLQRTNQRTINQVNKLEIHITDSTLNLKNLFSNFSNSRYRNILCLVFGTIFWLLIFFLSSSHYLFYVVDNSGSMGMCPGWNGTNCSKMASDPNDFTVNKVKKHLAFIFSEDKNLGSEKVSKSSLPLFPFYKFSSDIKVGLIEIGGKTELPNQCITSVLADPELNNREKLLQGLKKIEANDSGITALVQALKKADNSISLKTSNYLKHAASKNMILFTDGYEDNCGSNKTFCDAVSELPNDFDVELNIYGIGFSENECGQFKCFEKYSAHSCKPISNQTLNKGKLPDLGLVLALSPILTNVSYTSLILSWICTILIIWLIMQYGEYFDYTNSQNYLVGIYLFVNRSTTTIKNINSYVLRFFGEGRIITNFQLLLILTLFLALIILLILH